jgi:hypothetical protein
MSLTWVCRALSFYLTHAEGQTRHDRRIQPEPPIPLPPVRRRIIQSRSGCTLRRKPRQRSQDQPILRQNPGQGRGVLPPVQHHCLWPGQYRSKKVDQRHFGRYGGWDNFDSLKPLIDGGTEGFRGQSRVILPTVTSCIECQLDMHAPRAAVPLCTLATIPRQPQHCIEWAHLIAWDEERKGKIRAA